MRSLVHFWVVLLVATLAGAAGCKQGEGDPCQITDDCAMGLVCQESTLTCVERQAGTDDTTGTTDTGDGDGDATTTTGGDGDAGAGGDAGADGDAGAGGDAGVATAL